jgi:hypothetical protein
MNSRQWHIFFVVLTHSIIQTINRIAMKKAQRKAEYLRKLIDLPRPIVSELQKLAQESDKSLKGYIEHLIVNDVSMNAGDQEKRDLMV